jgi:4-alpha-glucanotransferase
MPFDRSSGILLHITSLPSYGGIGDFGPAAYEFADFLAASKQKYWQVLPLSPVGYGNSPYAALSAFAGNPLLISLEKLADWGWLGERQSAAARLADLPGRSGNVQFEVVSAAKLPLLHEAARNFLDNHADLGHEVQTQWARFEQYCVDNASWLNDWAYYSVLRNKYGTGAWYSWPKGVSRREADALAAIQLEHGEELAIEQVVQFAFDEQWRELRSYCLARGIRFIGDVAIFVSYDSADVWTHTGVFELNDDLLPVRVSGVPPDYFSSTGQRWGNPLYRWDALESQGFDWWVARIQRAKQLYDVIRLDHFRGFEAYWAIPAEDNTAINGKWIEAPGAALFSRLREALGELPFIAEDLGLITKEVDALREKFSMPGMRILQFGFGDRGSHNYLPHRYEPNTVVYTGTHDNDTTRGWWQYGVSPRERASVETYIGHASDGIVWALVRAAATSVADMCLFPLQDVLNLGSEARMNTPSQPENNWAWRHAEGALKPEDAAKLAALMEMTDRDDHVQQAK